MIRSFVARRVAPLLTFAALALPLAAPARADVTVFTNEADYNAVTVTTNIVTFDSQNGGPDPADNPNQSPYFEEGVTVTAYSTNFNVTDPASVITRPDSWGSGFNSGNYLQAFTGFGLGEPQVGGSGWQTFTVATPATAAGFNIASQYGNFGPAYDFTANITLYNGVTPIFTYSNYTAPAFQRGPINAGFLGFVSDVPFTSVRVDTIALGEYGFALYDNVRFTASNVPEPGAVAFGLAAFGTLGACLIRVRVRA